MANVMKISGPLLLLAALLAAGARAYYISTDGERVDVVTTKECVTHGKPYRVRQSPVDSGANWLSMNSCRLTSIPQHELSGLPALTGLALWRNELRELPVFEEHVCANWTLLGLHENQLTGIYNATTFSSCTKLKKLYLHNNHIEVIVATAFTALTHLRHLELQGNMIRYIPDQLLASNGKLEYLRIDGNRITHLPPEFASRLKRASAGLHTFYFHDNPWHCACLIELLADVRRAGVPDYSQGSYNGTQLVCNYISIRDYPCRKIREINFIAHGVR